MTVRSILLLTLVGCGPKAEDTPPTGPTFPDGFLWGAATAGFQSEMGCPTWDAATCEDQASDWYAWVTDPGILADASLHVAGDPVSVGPGMWETFEDDVALMVADGHSAHRMSIEWSRIFPDGAAQTATSVDELAAHADADAVARYHEMLAALRSAGIEPLVTVNHYTLPLWVHDGVACHADLTSCEADGWVTRERILPLVALYAGFLGREFGSEVDRWFTLNEPFATTLSGYLSPGEDRSAPPGLSFEIDATVAVMLNQIEGHAVMYDALHAEDSADADGDGEAAAVGIVMNMVAIAPKDPERPEDLLAAEHADYLYHRLYLDAITAGAWDADLDGIPEETRADLANRLDMLGINYYNRLFVTGLPFPPVPEIPIFDLFPEFSWEPYPEGLAEVVQRGAEWQAPIYVTENGTPFVEDRGVEVLDGHLGALQGAIDGGVDVRGYLYWTWVDNYEWNHGFDLRFGLYELDPVTKARLPRPVRDRYAAIIEANAL